MQFKKAENGGIKLKSRKKLNKILEIPKEVYSDEPQIILNSFEQMIIENYKGIMEYEEYYIRLSTYIGIINIHGFDLKLEKMTEDSLKINGKIENIEIERNIED